MVVNSPLEFVEGRKDTITNPVMIAEVLSKSTKSYDRDEKFAAYRTIPSFGEYILIGIEPRSVQKGKLRLEKFVVYSFQIFYSSTFNPNIARLQPSRT
jgi:Uma2 family endonuclease